MNNIYARQTIVSSVNHNIANDFVHENHRSGAAGSHINIISIGLLFNNELVAVAQFCTPRTSAKKRKYSTELLRLCFKRDIRIVGGASKLIKYYMKTYNPADIFTYQDTTGENTDVYEKAGMKLVKYNKSKKYLVAPGKTLDTAKRKEKEIFSISYVVSFGPDSLLGTTLGEQLKNEGKRKTNIELFQELGWTIVETTGDKVYEWFNPNLSFYTYKTTASDSDEYYYGVSSVKKPFKDLSIEDCLHNNYFGSGGTNKNNKFKNWKKKHENNLVKEVIELFDKKSSAYLSEKILVGDSWKDDELCLNSIAGGRYTGRYTGVSSRISFKECLKHGLTKFTGEKCAKCIAHKNITMKHCNIHGSTKHIGNKCRKCINEKIITMRNCDVHGLSKHIGRKCFLCSSASNNFMKVCSIHGLTGFNGDKCRKCTNPAITMENCAIHGLTKHRGHFCSACAVLKAISMKECSVHGLTKHIGETCAKCTSTLSVSTKDCMIHGATKHIGNKCRKCINDSNISMRNCDVHGLVKHIGDRCYSCRQNKYTIGMCDIHGPSSFVGESCAKCNKDKAVNTDRCEIHGSTIFVDGNCAKCRSNKSIDEKVCVYHGLTKHRGSSCCQCTVDNTNHAKFHQEKTKSNCHLCHGEIESGVRVLKTLSNETRLCPLCGDSFVPLSKRQVFCSNPHRWTCGVCGDDIMPVPRRNKFNYSCSKNSCKMSVNK